MHQLHKLSLAPVYLQAIVRIDWSIEVLNGHDFLFVRSLLSSLTSLLGWLFIYPSDVGVRCRSIQIWAFLNAIRQWFNSLQIRFWCISNRSFWFIHSSECNWYPETRTISYHLASILGNCSIFKQHFQLLN